MGPAAVGLGGWAAAGCHPPPAPTGSGSSTSPNAWCSPTRSRPRATRVRWSTSRVAARRHVRLQTRHPGVHRRAAGRGPHVVSCYQFGKTRLGEFPSFHPGLRRRGRRRADRPAATWCRRRAGHRTRSSAWMSRSPPTRGKARPSSGFAALIQRLGAERTGVYGSNLVRLGRRRRRDRPSDHAR